MKLLLGLYTLVSLNLTGGPTFLDSYTGAVSNDGQFIATWAMTGVSGDYSDVWIRDMKMDRSLSVSDTAPRAGKKWSVMFEAMDSVGQKTVLSSFEDFATGAHHNTSHLYLVDRISKQKKLIDSDAHGHPGRLPANKIASSELLGRSDDFNQFLFSSPDEGLAPNGQSGATYLKNMADQSIRVLFQPGQVDYFAGSFYSERVTLSGDGLHVFYVPAGQNVLRRLDLDTMSEQDILKNPSDFAWNRTEFLVSSDGTKLVFTICDQTSQNKTPVKTVWLDLSSGRRAEIPHFLISGIDSEAKYVVGLSVSGLTKNFSQLWSPESGRELPLDDAFGPTISPNGRWISVSSDKHLDASNQNADGLTDVYLMKNPILVEGEK